jgi:hypothetical protein
MTLPATEERYYGGCSYCVGTKEDKTRVLKQSTHRESGMTTNAKEKEVMVLKVNTANNTQRDMRR